MPLERFGRRAVQEVVRPQRDSNPCFGLERATSWASGRWGPAARSPDDTTIWDKFPERDVAITVIKVKVRIRFTHDCQKRTIPRLRNPHGGGDQARHHPPPIPNHQSPITANKQRCLWPSLAAAYRVNADVDPRNGRTIAARTKHDELLSVASDIVVGLEDRGAPRRIEQHVRPSTRAAVPRPRYPRPSFDRSAHGRTARARWLTRRVRRRRRWRLAAFRRLRETGARTRSPTRLRSKHTRAIDRRARTSRRPRRMACEATASSFDPRVTRPRCRGRSRASCPDTSASGHRETTSLRSGLRRSSRDAPLLRCRLRAARTGSERRRIVSN